MTVQTPYVGSRPFDTANETIFHGRAVETAALSKLWPGHRLTILHGPAGVGKTSLLRAGVLPMLASEPTAEVLPIGRLAFRADFPLAALPELNPFTFALLSSWYPNESPTRLSSSSIGSLLYRKSRTVRRTAPIPLLAAIDETDLLFRGTDQRDGHRKRFVTEIAEAVATQADLHLLIVVRTENLDVLVGLLVGAGLPAGFIARFPLSGLSPVAARRAISGPLDDAEHPLVMAAERLVEELGTGETAIDPALLQIVCSRLWDEIPPGNGIEIEQLPTMIDRILTDHCLRALATVAEEHGRTASMLVAWLKQVFRRRTKGVVKGYGRTHDLPNKVVCALEDVHLLHTDRSSGRRRYHLQHARLRPVIRRLDPRDAYSARHDRPRLDVAEAAFAAGEREVARYHAKAVAAAYATGTQQYAAAECLLGTIAYDLGQLELATEHYEAAAKAFDDLRDTGHVGMLLAALGQLKIGHYTTAAVNSLHAALTRLPGDLFIRTALAQALWYAGRTEAAIAVLDDALIQDGGTPEALRLRGELLADLNRPGPALRDLDRVNYADRPSTRAARALAMKTCGGVGLARPNERDLVIEADDSGPVLLRLARVRQLEGDTDSAASLAERAIKACRPPLPAHLHKAAERLMTRL